MSSAPLDIVMVAINAANTRLNGRVETLQAIGGQIIGNTQAFSQQVVNDAWRKMQNRLADMRYSGLQTETVFFNVGPAGTIDPAAQAYISFAGYFDGSALQSAPVLPQNLIRPYFLTERQNGTGALFTEMDPYPWSLPRVPKMNWNRSWLWRNNTLYIPGALVATDISLLYAQLFVDFADGSAPWFQSTIPIPNCIDSFADYICREIAVARGDQAAALAFQASAEDNARLILNQDSTGPKSIIKDSEFMKMRDKYTPGAPVSPPELKS
jgi:hypothetical protein